MAPRSAARLSTLLIQAADRLEASPDENALRRTLDLLSLTEAIGLEVTFERLQDVVFELLRGRRADGWSSSLREELAGRVGVEDPREKR